MDDSLIFNFNDNENETITDIEYEIDVILNTLNQSKETDIIKKNLLNLIELININPVITYNKLIKDFNKYFYEVIKNLYKDINIDIRNLIESLLTNFFELSLKRDIKNINTEKIFSLILQNTNGLKIVKDLNIIHGILCLLKAISFKTDFFILKYNQILEFICNLTIIKNDIIQEKIIENISHFCKLNVKEFQKNFFEKFFKYLIDSFKYNKNRKIKNLILKSFGELSLIIDKEVFILKINEIIILIAKDMENIINISGIECISNLIKNYSNIFFEKISFEKILLNIFKIGFSKAHKNFLENLLNLYKNNSNDNNLEKNKIIFISLNIISIILSKKIFPLKNASNKYIEIFHLDDDLSLLKNKSEPIRKNNGKNNLIQSFEYTLNLNIENFEIFKYQIRKELNNYLNDLENKIYNSNEINKIKFIDELTEIKINALNFLNKINHQFFNKDILYFYQNFCLNLIYYDKKIFSNDNDLITINYQLIENYKKILIAIINLLQSKWIPNYINNINNPKNINFDNNDNYILENILDTFLNFILIINDNNNFINKKQNINKININNNQISKNSKYKNINNNYIILLILKNFSNKFDILFTKEYFFLKLILILNIPEIHIKEQCVLIISRILAFNYTSTFLFLQKNILEIFFILDTSENMDLKELNIELLKYYIKYCGKYITNYLEIIFYKLIQIFFNNYNKEKSNLNSNNIIIDNDNYVNQNFYHNIIILNIIKEIINYSNIIYLNSKSKKDLNETIIKIIKICNEYLKEASSSESKEIILSLLLTIFENSSYDYNIYFNHLELVTNLINILEKSSKLNVRIIALKIFGFIGTMNPDKFEALINIHNNNENNEDYNDDEYENFDDEEIVIHNREQMKEKRKKNVANYFYNYYNNNKKNILKKKVEFEKLIYLKEINLSYYTTIKCLFNILIDENLENRDNQIINIINQIIKYFYDNKNEDKILIEFILNKYLEVLKNFSGKKLNDILESISNIIKNFKNNCINYLNEIINLIEKYIYDYKNNDKIFDILLNVINEYNNYIDIYLNRIIKILVKLLQDCNNKKNIQNITSLINSTIHNVCECLNKLSPKLNNYLNIIIPEIIIILNHYMVFNNEINEKSEEEIFKFISNIIPLYNFNEVIPNIVIILIKYINFKPSIYKKIMDIFIELLKKDINEFISYLTPILKILRKNNININEYLIEIKNLIENENEKNIIIEMKKYNKKRNNYKINKNNYIYNNNSIYNSSNYNFNKNPKHLLPYYNHKKNTYQTNSKNSNTYNFIIEEFNPTKCTIEEDWHEWFKNTSKQLFYYSPSLIINYCTNLSETLSNKLYNHAFFSIWNIFNQNQKDKILNYLINALNSETIPNEVLLIILNLFEFLEREDNNLNLFKINKVLAISSEKCNAFAKQLYYTEKNYIINNKDDENIEKLISLYYEVNLPESSMGLLEVDKDKKSNEENWYIKFHKYDKALEIIDNKIINNKDNIELIKNKIICLEGLSDWESLLKLSESEEIDYKKNKKEDNQELYKKFALASFNLNDWEKLNKFMGLYTNNNNNNNENINNNNNENNNNNNNENNTNNSYINLNINNDEEEEYETNFLYSVLNIHQKNYEKAQNYIDTARKCIIDKIKNLLSENYERAYKLLLKNEHLYELEEIIKLNINPNNSNIENYNYQKKILKNRWDERLDLITEDTETYERILAIRGLIFSFEEKYDMHLELAKICRKDDHFVKCMNVLERINKIDTDNKNIKISIALSLNKCLNENDRKNDSKKAFENLKKIIEDEIDKDNENNINSKLKSKVYFYYGYLYFKEKDKELNEENVKNILSYFQLSIKFNEKYYKAWHYYSFVNYKFFEILKISNNNKKNDYAINALKGFTNSIIIGGKNISKTLQDILRLIDIWFQNDNNDEIFLNSLNDSFKRIPIDSWLQVIPQLLARVNIKNNLIKKNLIQLLKTIGFSHPWSVIYPLIVMNKSENKIREEISSEILTEMRKKYNTLINECTIIIDELNRSALLLHEKCQEAIEEAAKAYFEKNDLDGMVYILRNFSENFNKYKPITINEKHFYQKYKSALREAYNYIKDYETYNDINYIKLSWDIYHSVFINISNEYKSNYLNLDNISPLLANFTQSEVSMPGVNISDYTIIKITGFNKNLLILNSKQHPRKITMYGSDGKEYIFLLKGHEDLRQDERAMQLFFLINTFLSIDVDTSDKFLAIKRFPVIALSNNTGLLGWVRSCDTLSILIKEYRISYKIPLDLEQRFIFNNNPNYDSSCMLNKLEIFKNALDNTDGNDIYKILWKFSKNSEIWLDRRTNYSRSLAVMSMVGYILGLGDRHPSNLMIDRKSGKIMHIDFGDCFEVAMRREKFPEKVPFRLTRMMVKALEVSCIEGTFKFTCVNVMRILRNNKDSLIAILSAFIHDPLISFRFLIPLLLKSNKENKNYNYISKSSKINSYKSFTNNYLLKSLNNNYFNSVINNNFINNNINQTIKRNFIKRSSNIYRANTFKENNVNNFKKNKNLNKNNNNFEIQIEQLKHEKILMGSAERQLYNEFTEKEQIESEELNKIAKIVLERIIDKLKGTDFNKNLTLDYKSQVDKLIQQATNDENLCQMYFGWCSYW